MSLIKLVKKYSERIKNGRTEYDVYNHLIGECEELQKELSTNDPGPDGVMGESIDVILCALDMIFLDNPNITEEEILEYADKKCQKWENKYKQIPENNPNELNIIRTAFLDAGFNEVDCYRYNSASIRLKVIDSRFEGLNHTQKANVIEPILEKLPKEIQRDIIRLILMPSNHETLGESNDK